MIEKKNSTGYFSAILAAVFLGIAWWYPDTIISAILTWICIIFLIISVNSKNPLSSLCLVGLIVHPVGFYWLVGTITDFGYFHIIPALLIFSLFVVLSSVQFVFFALIYKYLPPFLNRFCISGAIAWTAAELCSIKIFPWHLGHTQIALTPLVQFADVTGSIGISFLTFWILESIYFSIKKREILPPLYITSFLIFLALAYGSYKIYRYDIKISDKGGYLNPAAEAQPVTLVQGNISLIDKHDESSVDKNTMRYMELSKPYDTKNNLIIWPETSVNTWIYSEVKNVSADLRIPRFDNATLLFGAPTFLDSFNMYNSTLLVRADGNIGRPYHKRVLMPFGEYTPFVKIFPILRQINVDNVSFKPGKSPALHQVTFVGSNKKISVSSLICYEDVVQDLAVEAVAAGAEVLVNQTNDAWFGDTVAPYQHHLIASFRAIETGRYLIRATNTGFTAIVDPLGRTIASTPTYEEGVVNSKVYPYSNRTIFSRVQNHFWVLLALVTTFITAIRILRPKS